MKIVVMGDDLCSRRLSSNPGHWMVMNIFSQWFVVKLLFEKTKNKWKEAWAGPFSFFKKIISKLGPTDFRIVSCSTRIWEKLKIFKEFSDEKVKTSKKPKIWRKFSWKSYKVTPAAASATVAAWNVTRVQCDQIWRNFATLAIFGGLM